jgi:hypothetical protein
MSVLGMTCLLAVGGMSLDDICPNSIWNDILLVVGGLAIGYVVAAYRFRNEFEEDTQSPGTEGKGKITEVEEDEHLRELALPQETEED